MLTFGLLILMSSLTIANQHPAINDEQSLECDAGGLLGSSSPRPTLFDTFPLGDFHIRLYQRSLLSEFDNNKKFYYAPLALLEHTSAKSSWNHLAGQHQMTFRVEMWNEELHQMVTQYLSNVTHQTVEWNQVSVLPFDRVSIRCQHEGCSSADSRLISSWYSFAQSPKKMQFRISCRSEAVCRLLTNQMTRHPDHQFSQLSLHFLLERSRIKKINVPVNGANIWSGRTMADVNRRFPDASFALVTANDRDTIITETLSNTLRASDSFDDQIIDYEDERRWKRHLENLIFEPYSVLVDDNQEENQQQLLWQSVYWNSHHEIDAPRPDTLAKKLNRIYTAAQESDQKLIADHLVERVFTEFSKPAMALLEKMLSKDTLQSLANALQTVPQLVSDRLNDISQRTLNWNGNQFLPKGADKFFKINLEKLRQISPESKTPLTDLYSPSLKYFTPDLSLNLNIRPEMSQMNFERNPTIPDSIKNRFEIESTTQDFKKEKPQAPGLLQTIGTAVTGRGLEIAPYTVIRSEENYEERLYPAQKWVTTKMQHISRDAASSAMFWKLFNYISGENNQQIKIAMTAPVSVLIEPGSGPNCESTFTMAFYVPDAFQEDTPEPTNDQVSIEQRPEFKVFARTYGGFTNDRVTPEERDLLWASLSDEDKQTVDLNAPYYFAGYDPPFKLFFRRNEIWIIQRDAADSLKQKEQHTGHTLDKVCQPAAISYSALTEME